MRDLNKFYKITKNKPPSELLVKALKYVTRKDKALDIGAGALKDTHYLLKLGFTVTAIDKSCLMAKEAELIKSDKFHYFISSFVDFDFFKNKYDIVSAMYSLPFNSPDNFDVVLKKIKQSLVSGGIFCGQFFGVNDEWNTNSKMTFHTEEQIKELFTDMKILLLDEEEKDGKTALGTQKHWHIFHIIAKTS